MKTKSGAPGRPPRLRVYPPARLAIALAAVGLFALVCVCQVLGQTNQDLPFTSASTGADGPLRMRFAPNPSYGGAMAYAAARQQVLLFGGYRTGVGIPIVSESYLWSGTNWTQTFPFNSPSRRYDHAMAYDAARQMVLLFGGYAQDAGGVVGDTWTWDGTSWLNLSPLNNPASRFQHAIAYDAARQQVVLFGGYHSAPLSDTWIWDGTNWTSLNPQTTPRERRGHSMAYDSARQRVVMFGGYQDAGNVYLNDTWTWDGTNWTAMTPTNSPPNGYGTAIAFDSARQQVVLFGGYDAGGNAVLNNTWVWDGTNWTQLNPLASPTGRSDHSLAYDSARQRTVLFGGYSNGSLGDSWLWDGTNWSYYGSSVATFDMTSRADGVWNYTSIDIDSGVTVTFKRNAANTPVRWLAMSNVNINGTLSLDGANGGTNPSPGQEAPGGPGGFAGGLGGIRFDQSGSYAGTPGQGPGGGLPGVTIFEQGYSGTYAGTYGNSYLQPLIGGSGGGGTGSNPTGNGVNGGGGGGAILISSSRDITVNGEITTRGGAGAYLGGGNYAGNGSGGAIRLQADRVSGSGSLYATGPNGNQGYIRVEAYYRSLASSTSPLAFGSAPVAGQNFDTQGNGLVITSVGGVAVRLPSLGDTSNPDVMFTNAGPILVTVTSTNIPDLTPVQLRVTANGQIITASNVLSGGTATFTNIVVPKGVGTIQASATFTLGN